MPSDEPNFTIFLPLIRMPSLFDSSKLRKNKSGPSRFLALWQILPLKFLAFTNALHHMRRGPSQDLSLRAETRPLSISNFCEETIYPGMVTQSGIPPVVGGFQLDTGATRDFTVSADWQGRVWGRTNCSFNFAGTGPSSGGYGKACTTGDCGGVVNCKATVSAVMKSPLVPKDIAKQSRVRYL